MYAEQMSKTGLLERAALGLLYTLAFLKNLSFRTRLPALPICEGLTAMNLDPRAVLCGTRTTSEQMLQTQASETRH